MKMNNRKKINDTDEHYAHDCRNHSDGLGFCKKCGSIISGSWADREIHGFDGYE